MDKDIIKWIVYICPIYRAGDFICGLVAGYFFVTTQNERKRLYTVVEIIVILLMAGQVAIYSFLMDITNWTLTLFWLPTSIICVYLFAFGRGVVSKILSRSKILIEIGNLSGEAFLIHQICIKAVEVIVKRKWIVAVISFVATLGVSMAWRFFYNCKIRKFWMKV